MKSIIISMIAVAGLIVSGSTIAAELPAAAKKKCGTCHKVAKKGIGPSYSAIAEKYKGDADAVSKLTASITKGGALGWNMGKMPPRGIGAKPDLIKEMSEYIVSLSK